MMPSIDVKNVSLSYPIFGARPHKKTPKLDDINSNQSNADRDSHAGAINPVTASGSWSIAALKNVSFELKAGDRLGLLGRNGSGKSTLLRVLAGIYEPDCGSVAVQGKVAPLFSVGLGVRRDASGRRNIVLRGLINGLSHSQAVAKVDEIIEFSELGPYIDLPVRTYSAGMAMRLAFAAATAFSPEILLLDEWIGAGDEEFRKKAAGRMMSMVEGSGITVIASHRRQLLEQVCTHGLWLEGGEQRAFGPIADVFTEKEKHSRIQ